MGHTHCNRVGMTMEALIGLFGFEHSECTLRRDTRWIESNQH